MAIRIKGKEHYYALLCDGCVGDEIICGVLSTKEEALQLAHDVDGCVATHRIVKVSLVVQLSGGRAIWRKSGSRYKTT